MITFRNEWFSNRPKADQKNDSTFGNILFFIASTIGIATKNGYTFGFPEWNNSEFFTNKLPKIEPGEYRHIEIPEGKFYGFNIPDNSSIFGYMQSEKYFEHCTELIRSYFTMKPICEIYDDCILIHCRNYAPEHIAMGFPKMTREYFMKALTYFPNKKVVVITDNIQKAKEIIKEDFEYVSNTPIEDFYKLSHTKYLIGSPSSFSWWAAWLSRAKAVFPANWFPGLPVDTRDVNCSNWITI